MRPEEKLIGFLDLMRASVRGILATAFGFVIAALAAVPMAVHAQDAFFHRGAQHFLGGSNQLAKAEVERGLQLHPDDPSLKKFWELLNQQQQQDQQNNEDKNDQKDEKDKKDQKDQKESQSKDQQKQDQQKQDQQKQDQQKPDQQQQKPEDQQQQSSAGKKDQEKKDGEEAKASQPGNPDEQEGDPDGEAQQQAAMVRMTPQQAIRLLETLKAEERTLQFKPILRTNRTDRILKDW